MEEHQSYLVEITPEAEHYYLELLEYLYKHHSPERADRKSEELLLLAESLNEKPYRGRTEDCLAFLEKGHRFLVYRYTRGKTIKIIYFIEEKLGKVYITDFFPTKMDKESISKRNK